MTDMTRSEVKTDINTTYGQVTRVWECETVGSTVCHFRPSAPASFWCPVSSVIEICDLIISKYTSSKVQKGLKEEEERLIGFISHRSLQIMKQVVCASSQNH